MAPSSVNGAVTPLDRSPQMKVVVFPVTVWDLINQPFALGSPAIHCPLNPTFNYIVTKLNYRDVSNGRNATGKGFAEVPEPTFHLRVRELPQRRSPISSASFVAGVVILAGSFGFPIKLADAG